METAEKALLRGRRVLAAVRHAPDRLLHPLRRRSTLARLQREELPTQILFICHGNICRSAYAHRALADRLPPEARTLITISSAGFVGPGRPSPSEAIQVARSRGVDLSNHRSRLVTLEMVRGCRLIVAMDARQRRALIATYGTPPDSTLAFGDLDPHGIRRRGIQDPYKRPAEVFERVFARIDRCLEEFVRGLLPEGVPARVGGSGETREVSRER